jgi:MFS family permease
MEQQQTRMRRVIYAANFLLAFGTTVTLFTNSSFIEHTVGLRYVGAVYALSALLAIAILSRTTKTLERIGNRTFFLRYGALYALSLAAIILPVPAMARVIGLGAYLCVTTVLIFSINVSFAHLSPKAGRGKTRALFLLLGNVGGLLAPTFAARAIDFGGYVGTYALDLLVFLALSVLLFFGLRNFRDAQYAPPRILGAIRHTIRESTLRNVVAANFILQFFYAWMVVYTPIYLSQELGFSWDSIGLIFSCMIAAFVVLDYPLGRLADWIGSEKELAAIGFAIMSGSVFMLGAGGITTVLGVGIVLFCSRIGAATVEAMTEIHFFKIASDTDPSMLTLFSDIRPLSYVVAPLLGALCVAFLPFNMIFVVLGIILLVGCYVATQMEHTGHWWMRAHAE